MYDITPIIEAVAALIGVIVTCVLIPFIKSKTTASQQAEINAWVKIAVSAAEHGAAGPAAGGACIFEGGEPAALRRLQDPRRDQ